MQPHMFGASPPVETAPGATMVTKADLQGQITYANDAFIEASGYTLDELLDNSHRIVRHPDTPAPLFAEMWAALHSGAPWQGLLKNRSKNGQFFWVNACIVPIRRNEQVTGYMAVLSHAAPAAIVAAQQRYAQIAAHGLPKPRTLPTSLGVRAGMRAGFLFVSALVLAGGALGIGGLKLSDTAFTRVYQNQFEPAAAVSQVEARLSDIRANMLELELGGNANSQTSPHRQGIESLQNAFDEIQEVFDRVTVSKQGNTSASVALATALQQYTTEGRNVLNHAAVNNAGRLDPSTQQQLRALQNKASLSAHALREALMETAQQGFSETLQRNERIRTLAMVGIVLGLLCIAVVGQQFVRSIVDPLNAAIRRLNRIAEGDLRGEVQLSGTGETAQLNHAAIVMQQHLKVMLDEIALASRRIHQHCQALNQSLHEVTEHSEAQHDQVHGAIRALNQAVEETSDLSQRAERLMQLASESDTATDTDARRALEHETRELATATRLAVFGAEEVAGAMQQVAALIVENRGEAQLAWQASEELMRTAGELTQLVDFFAPAKPAPEPAATAMAASVAPTREPEAVV